MDALVKTEQLASQPNISPEVASKILERHERTFAKLQSLMGKTQIGYLIMNMLEDREEGWLESEKENEDGPKTKAEVAATQ
mmetsp:Transcript_10186/g.17161  ORF Transcript_10186/g.17161 Transcript_10186/m.17161 type:complete len:81 (+) Transcript_10186:848-1090(+)